MEHGGSLTVPTLGALLGPVDGGVLMPLSVTGFSSGIKTLKFVQSVPGNHAVFLFSC